MTNETGVVAFQTIVNMLLPLVEVILKVLLYKDKEATPTLSPSSNFTVEGKV